MKKFLLSLFLVFALSTQVFAADYYSVGVDAYNKGSFDNACANLEHAVRINPQNVNARYYLAQAYLHQQRVSDAMSQYTRIIVIAPDSDAARLSQKGIALVKQAEKGVSVATAKAPSITSGQNNYLDYVLTSDGKILKWASFPITVYIEPKPQKSLVIKAFEQWQSKSNNLVRFKFVGVPTNAQITVDFRHRLETTSGQENYISGYSKPYYQGNNIIKSEIHLLDMDLSTGQKLGDDYVECSVLHEIGHSLGFRGHSPDEKDIMYGSATSPKLSLTQRDINTLYAFYQTDERTLIARSRNNSGSNDVRLQQALAYVKQVPDKSVGWANLGDIYRGKKMYVDSLKCYKKAISIEPSKAELYNLIGATYLEMGDSQNSFINYKKACDLDRSNEYFLYQFASLCLRTGQKSVGRSYISAYVNANPQAASDAKIRTLINAYNGN